MAIAFSCLDLSRKYIILAPERRGHFKMTELPCLTFDVIYADQCLGVCLQVSDQQWAGAGSRQH